MNGADTAMVDKVICAALAKDVVASHVVASLEAVTRGIENLAPAWTQDTIPPEVFEHVDRLVRAVRWLRPDVPDPEEILARVDIEEERGVTPGELAQRMEVDDGRMHAWLRWLVEEGRLVRDRRTGRGMWKKKSLVNKVAVWVYVTPRFATVGAG